MKKTLLLSCLMILSLWMSAQMTFVPDDNFEQALIDLGYDSALDDSVATLNINIVTSLDINEKGISDLTGIEAFSALERLDCRSNRLTNLNVGNNILLQSLLCANNRITSLDVSQNTSLTYLVVNDNQLSSLDVSQNKALSSIVCDGNQLSSLDVSQNTSLTFLSVSGNQFVSIDVRNNALLSSLSCGNNNLASLDVSQNTSLAALYCSGNQLSNLDVSHNRDLTTLFCSFNRLTSLDVSQNTSLKVLICNADGNEISNLDLSNNAALTYLDCTANPLTSLNLRNNTLLETLRCDKTQLSSLDVTQNIALRSLYCSSNQINTLDISQNVNLTDLNCEGNGMESLDISNNKALTYLYCAHNKLTFESLETIVAYEQQTDSVQSYAKPEVTMAERPTMWLNDVPFVGQNSVSLKNANVNATNMKSSGSRFEGLRYAPQDSIGLKKTMVVKEGETFQINGTAPGKHNHYQWRKGDNILPEQTSATLILSNVSKKDAGIYTCQVTNYVVSDLTLYTRPITLEVDFKTINEGINEEVLSVYPNPVRNMLTVDNKEKCRIEIHDISGGLVYQDLENKLNRKMDVSFLSPGTYFLKLSSEKRSSVFKLIKH